MPLHDWRDEDPWENFHRFWIFRIAEAIQPLLPEGYRVYVGSYSRVGLTMATKSDLGVASPVRMAPTNGTGEPHESASAGLAPDDEVAVGTIEPWKAVYVQYRGMMVAAVEIVSPCNKDRASSKAESAARYAGYLRGGINLMLIDLLPNHTGSHSQM